LPSLTAGSFSVNSNYRNEPGQPVIEKILAHQGLVALVPPRAAARGQMLRAA